MLTQCQKWLVNALDYRNKPLQRARIVFFRLLPSVAAGYFIFFFLFSFPAQAHQSNTLHESNFITVGSELDYPPYALVTKEGKASGFSVDLMQASCDVMGVHVHFQVGPWDEMRKALEDGAVDALPLVGYSKERALLFDFSSPHTVAYGGVLKHVNSPDIQSLDELKQQVIIVMKADNTHDFLIKNRIGSRLIVKESMEGVLQALDRGEAKYAVLPRLVGLLTAKELGLHDLELTDIRINAYGAGYSFAVQKGNSALLATLNQGLSLIKANGTYDKIYQKWFGAIDQTHLDYQKIVKIAFIAASLIAFITIIIFIWLATLRRQVKIKTKELATLSERYQDLYDHAPDMFVSVDAKSAEIITCNQRLADNLGYTKDELIGKAIYFVYHPDCMDAVKSAFASFVQHGEVHNIELQLQHKNGSKIDVELNVSAVRDKNGEVLYSRSSWRDIRERKEHERSIRLSEGRFKLLASLSPVGIFYTDAAGGCLYVNDKWREIAGLSADQAMGEGWVQSIYAEDRASVFEIWQHATLANIPFFAEYRFQDATGKITWVLGQAQNEYDEHGNTIGYVGTITDISKRIEAEEAIQLSTSRMNEAQRMAKIGSWELNIITGELWWSDEVFRIFAINADQFEASYDAFLNAIHPEDRAEVDRAYIDAIDNKTPYDINHRLLMPDASVKYIHEHCETFYNDQGRAVRSIGSVQDITDQFLIEQERLKLQSQLEHTQRLESLGVLAGGIAHDFNNILTAIMGNAALAEYKTLPDQEDMQKYLANIVQSSEKAANLCKQMLAYSGKGKFQVRLIDLSNIVNETSQLLEVSIGKSVNLNYHLAKELPRIEADVAQVQQVIMNLVINASDAIGNNNGMISIVTGVMDVDQGYLHSTSTEDPLPEGRYVFLEVSDSGCGMDKQTQKRLFDPFFSTKTTGHGLGMSAVQGIIRGHHGAIKVYSELGHGTTFKMLLPINELTASLKGHTDHASTAIEKAPQTGKVLVVDDEASIRDVATMMLKALGYGTLTAVDGQDGLDVYRENQADIVAVLLDMTMPIMDGKTCFRELKRMDENVKVLLSSGYNEQEATSLFTGKGLAGFIQKPYSPKQLASKLHQAIDLAKDK